MEPKLSFTIPSTHDNTTLDCRLYYTISHDCTPNSYKARGAIIAHPYAPLGGCYDDPVVNIIVAEILKQSFGFVCTFNFRGAFGSAGHTSWTGKAERADYESVAGFMIQYLQQCEVPAAATSNVFDSDCELPVQLVFGGYSYGSWICSHLPDHLEVWKQFESASEGTAAAEIKARAQHLATQTNHEIRAAWQESNSQRPHTYSIGGEETPPDRRRRSGEGTPNKFSSDIRKSIDFAKRLGSVRKKHNEPSSSAPGVSEQEQPAHDVDDGSAALPKCQVEAAYLLVSPLLPPISAFTTLPFGLNALKAHSEETLQKLSTSPCLAVFGGDDIFTSARKLRAWAQDISNRPSSRFQFIEIENAGHFWRNHSAQRSLKLAIREWIHSLSDGTPKCVGSKSAVAMSSEVGNDINSKSILDSNIEH